MGSKNQINFKKDNLRQFINTIRQIHNNKQQ